MVEKIFIKPKSYLSQRFISYTVKIYITQSQQSASKISSGPI